MAAEDGWLPCQRLVLCPQQAARVEMHSLLLPSEAGLTHSPGYLHPLLTGYTGNTQGLKGGGLTTPTGCTLNPIPVLPWVKYEPHPHPPLFKYEPHFLFSFGSNMNPIPVLP